MSWETRAVIDIGTNSVKLLVAEVRGAAVRPRHEGSEQTRLGEGFYETHELQPEPIVRTARAVARFAALAREQGAAQPRIIATSAARDARNPEAFLSAIRQATGLRVEIISGEQEAEWAFHGVAAGPSLAGQRVLLLDVGGGSSEFILGADGVCQFRHSFQLGALRLLERCRPGEAPTVEERNRCLAAVRAFLAEQVAPLLAPALRAEPARPPQLVGVGGSATVLAAIKLGLKQFDRDRLEMAVLTRAELFALMERLWATPLPERRRIVGLPPERADVILPGAAIYRAVLEWLDLPELRVSTRGMRFGALMGGGPAPADAPGPARG